WEAFLVLRGLKTLGLRVRTHCENARQVAEFLQSHPRVRALHYPGLPSHPQHELAKSQMDGMGGIVSFEVEGGIQEAQTFMNAL
ncbi:methionine gamma-lyase, partial [Escherichia coli]|nr:methionine gamma-lyase [Escherichia coli]